MDSKWASGKGGAEILFTDRVSVELYLDRWAEHEIVMWTITVEPQYFKLGCSATRKTWNTWNISRMFTVLRPITRHASKSQNLILINVIACSVVFSCLIGFFIATQHSRNISGVHSFPGSTFHFHFQWFTLIVNIDIQLTSDNSNLQGKSTCHMLKKWFSLSRVKWYRNDLRGNKHYFAVTGGSSYQGENVQ